MANYTKEEVAQTVEVFKQNLIAGNYDNQFEMS